VVAIVAVFCLFPVFSLQAKTIIENDIKVEADTGGNTGNTVQGGQNKAQVDIQTKINGKTVEDTSLSKQDQNGEKIEISVESKHQAEDGQVKSETAQRINGQEQKTTSQIVPLSEANAPEATNGTGPKGSASQIGGVKPLSGNDKESKSVDTTNTRSNTLDTIQAESSAGPDNNQTGGLLAFLTSLWEFIRASTDKLFSVFV